MYVYIQSASNPPLYTVGHYAPDGKWIAESDHTDSDEAAKRVHYLNGGQPATQPGIYPDENAIYVDESPTGSAAAAAEAAQSKRAATRRLNL